MGGQREDTKRDTRVGSKEEGEGGVKAGERGWYSARGVGGGKVLQGDGDRAKRGTQKWVVDGMARLASQKKVSPG